MAQLLRGEIRWVNIETVSQVVGHEQGNRRPALILSNDRFNTASQLVIVALVGSSASNRTRATSVQIRSAQMPITPSWVLTEQIRTLSAQRMGELIGMMSPDELEHVFRLMYQWPIKATPACSRDTSSQQ